MESQQQIDEMERLLTNFDDSSDEEDNYKDLENEKNALEHYKKANPNLNSQYLKRALTLEDEGRRIIYNPISRKSYYDNTKKLLKHDNINFDLIDESSLLNNITQSIIVNSLTLNQQEMQNLQEQINQQLQITLKLPNLKSFMLKQSNRSDILPEFGDILEPIISKVLEKNKDNFFKKERKNLEKVHTLTSNKILEIELIKEEFKKEVLEKLKILKEKYQQASQDQKPKKEIIVGQYFWSFSEPINRYIENASVKNPNGNALNSFMKDVLDNAIKEYLDNGFLDRKKQNYNFSWIKKVEDLAIQNNIQSIINCNFALLESEKNKLSSSNEPYDYTFDMIGQQFLNNLKSELGDFTKIERKTLKTTYIDSNLIGNMTDFYSKQHLLYRSAIRQSRNNNEKEVARTIVFDEDQDLSVQKKQDIKAQNKAGQNHIANRGTIQEEVYNLGNYENILKKIESLGMSDANVASLIRKVFKKGSQELDNITTTQEQKVILAKEQKQTIVELVELLFGTEGFRSPAAIIETNMALDLIINGKVVWKDLLIGKNNIVGAGGQLSYTMKSSAGAGGIECGRRLSEDVNVYHQRKHKYGGEPIDKNSEGYKEYLKRKYDITKQWESLHSQVQTQQNASLRELIRKQDKQWYNFK